MTADASAYRDRIEVLAERAREDREAFEPPENPPDEERALEYLREGVGPAVWVYVEGRTGGRTARFSDVEFSMLERALNDWLSLYTRCYGVHLDAEFSVREVATVLVETRNVLDTAQLLTHVPERAESK